MSRPRVQGCWLAALFLAALVRPAAAAWPHSPANGNLPVAVAPNAQGTQGIVSDGSGGAFVVWLDDRAVWQNSITYTQWIDADATVRWSANGVAVCTDTRFHAAPAIVRDGAGGVILAVAGMDAMTLDTMIRLQRLNAEGLPQWPKASLLVNSNTPLLGPLELIPDGEGGAILAWHDRRDSIHTWVFAQRFDALGQPRWAPDGVAISSAPPDQSTPRLVSDGSGGAIVCWGSRNEFVYQDLYAQRVSAEGVLQWGAEGVRVSTAVGAKQEARVVQDGQGGAIVTWSGGNPFPVTDIRAQRIRSDGVRVWTPTGVFICSAPDQQILPSIVPDGDGGAIIGWSDHRDGTQYIPYAQRVDSSGVVLWPANGMPLGTPAQFPGPTLYPTMISDGAGGAIATWHMRRDATTFATMTIAQRISAAGVLLWGPQGVALNGGPGTQDQAGVASDDAHGAIFTWSDTRGGPDYDLYAQRVERFGRLGNPEPRIASIQDVGADQGGFVTVSWTRSYLDTLPGSGVEDYRVWRCDPRAEIQAGIGPDGGIEAKGCEWVLVGLRPAAGSDTYALVVPTVSDSTAIGVFRSRFMVEARSSSDPGTPYWFSAVDSGYSVDDLPPETPVQFTGEYSGGTVSLRWHGNFEADLAGYRLHRGAAVDFEPGASNRVAELADTTYVDVVGSPAVYKLTAIDVHGNESEAAVLIPSGTLDATATGAARFSLSPLAPNPLRSGHSGIVRFGLSQTGSVELEVLDLAGRRVRTLHSGALPAGEHAARWDSRWTGGRRAAAGLYLVRLRAFEGQASQRLVIVD